MTFDSDFTINKNSKIKSEFGDAFLNKKGYYVVRFGREHYQSLHKLIYRKYHGEIPKGWEIHHMDCNKRNNSPNNLVALSRSQHRLLHEELRKKKGVKKNV